MAEWAVGDTVGDGRYRVLAVFGSGGMGLVYRVRHLGWNIDLAVKSPRAELFRTDTDRELFVGEAQAWVSLGLHPNVCGCHYVRMYDGVPRVFAEYIGGGTLRDWVRDGELYRGGPARSLPRILDIAVQVAWGLAHAHDNRLVHQDVKPANILMDGDGTAKVTDFGLAKARSVLSSGPSAPGADASVLVAGMGYTPLFASPEQVARDPLSRRTDVYSHALVVLEMFAGTVFWPVGMPGRVALNTLLAGGPPPPHLPPVPDAVAALLRACLDPDPDARPRTMTEVADGLLAAYGQALGTPYPRQRPVAADLLADELSNRALSYLDLGQQDEASQAFADAIAADPRNLYATYNYGLLRWRTTRTYDDTVLADVREAGANYAEPAVVARMLAEINRERGAASDADRMFDGQGPTEHARPSGRYVLVPDRHDVVLRDLDPGEGGAEEVRRWTGLGSSITALDLSLDGRVAVAGTVDGTIAVFDVDRDIRRHLLTGHTARAGIRRVTVVRLSADGRTAISGGADGTLRVWDIESGQEVRRIDAYPDAIVLDLAVTDNGNVAIAVDVGKRIQIWDVGAGTKLAESSGFTSLVSSVAIAGASYRIAFGQADGAISMMDLTADTQLSVSAHSGQVASVCLSPDGRTLASIGLGGQVRIWASDTLRCLRTCDADPTDPTDPTGFDRFKSSVRFDPDGRRVLSVTPGRIGHWAVPAGYTAPFQVSRPRPGAVLAAADLAARDALARFDTEVAAGNVPAALAALREARAVPGHERSHAAMTRWRQLTPHTVRTGLRGVWDHGPLTGHESAVIGVGVSEDPDRVVSADRDGRLRVWDLDSREQEVGIRVGRPIAALDVARTDGRILYDDGSNEILIWRPEWTRDGTVQVGSIGPGLRSPLAVTPDARYLLATIDETRELGLYGLRDGRVVRRFAAGGDEAPPALSDDGRLLATVGYDTVRVYDLDDGRLIRELRPHSRVAGAAFSPDRRLILTTGRDGGIRVFSLVTGHDVSRLEGHTRAVVSAVFSPDGRFAASAAQDDTVRIWNVETGECLRTVVTATHTPTTVRFSADGCHLLLGTELGPIPVWVLDWELAAPEPAGWDDGAEPTLAAFLATHTPVGEDAPAELRTDEWVDAHVDALMRRLTTAGFGWLRRAGVHAALARAASTWTRPESYEDLTGANSFASRFDTSDRPPARSQEELDVYSRQLSCPECGSDDAEGYLATHEFPDGSSLFDGVTVYCDACSARVRLPFRIVDGGELTSSYARWFGGAQPSTLVGPAQWLVYADWRAAATPQTAQTAGLAAAAVAEALKFIPDGADRVSDAVLDRFDPTGRDPETLTRSALQTRLDRHLRELAALKEQEDRLP